MKIQITITVGDKLIGDSYHEYDEVFRLRNQPRHTIDMIQAAMMVKMGEAIDKAITELWMKGQYQEPTSYPVALVSGKPYDVVGDAS
jgi:hypothetical protein